MPFSLAEGLTEKQLSLHPFCHTCSWRRGGLGSWDGLRCKCGESAPSFKRLFAASDAQAGVAVPSVRETVEHSATRLG
jgi:hypothetical protein